MNYNEAMEYIHSTQWLGSRPGLSRVGELTQLMGNPQNQLKFIHVAGTNGKGSFCKMTETILRSAGYKTGLYISPDITTFNERMSVDGEYISDDELTEITEYVKPLAESMADAPTEFELVTAIAFEYFLRKKCDIVVLETGMGGRLDSTNIIENPVMSVICEIAFDHMAYLGDTIEKIAYEKAGIIKNGRPVLFGGKSDGALNVISNTAKEKNSKLYTTDYSKLKNITYSLKGSTFDYSAFKDVHIPLLGIYQPENTASVLAGIEILRENGYEISDEAIYRGLKNTRWNGRFEILCENPLVIFDGSHNPHGLKAASDSVKIYFGNKKVNVITGVMADKNYSEIVEILKEITLFAYTVTPGNIRALDSKKYAEAMREQGVPSKAFDTVGEAVNCAYADSKQTNTPLFIAGSLYMYAEIKKNMADLI